MLFITGVVAASWGEFPLFSIKPNCFVFPWFSIFSYPLLCMFTLYWVVFVNTWQKGGDFDEMWEYVRILFVLFRGSWNCFGKGENIKTFWCIKLRRRVSLLLFLFCVSYYCLYAFIVCCLKSRNYFVYLYFPHMRLCVLFSVLGNIQVDSIGLLSTLATDR